MTGKELFTTYGSFMTLILVGLGYFIKRYYDLKSKKHETSYSFFQQNKLSAIIKFFDNYSKVERMWHHFPIYRVLSKEMNADQIDELIWPFLNSIKVSISELTIYLNEEEIKPFCEINDNLLKINGYIIQVYSEYNSDEKSVSLANQFHIVQGHALKECEMLIKKIGNKTRSKFYS